MKVGIDGVLLGAWTSVETSAKILDIGTGTGLIALMLAQRSDAEITAIDIEPNAVIQSKENVRNSPWTNRIAVLETSLQDFSEMTTEKFDLIVSNPPYFVNSLKAPSENRSTARHTDSLTHEELILLSYKLLIKTGRICLILPVNEGLKCVDFANQQKLYCTRKVHVFPKPNTQAKRLLLEFSPVNAKMIEAEIVIESESRHSYSAEFTHLVKNFYLKL